MKKLFTIFVILFVGQSALFADWGPFATGTAELRSISKGRKHGIELKMGLPHLMGLVLEIIIIILMYWE
jgi:hypothetical protein